MPLKFSRQGAQILLEFDLSHTALVFGEKVTHTCLHIHMQKKIWSVKSRTSKLCSCLAAGMDSEGIATMPQASMFWCCASACLCQMGTSWDLGILGSWDLGILGSWDKCKVVLFWVYPLRLPGCQVSNCKCGGMFRFWIILMMACTKVGLYW